MREYKWVEMSDLLAVHMAEQVKRESSALDSMQMKRLIYHKKKWHPFADGFRFGAHICDSAHYLTLLYQDGCYSALVEKSASGPKIFRLENVFNITAMTKILLLRHPQANGRCLYQVYDGSHRLAYMAYHGLKRLPLRYVVIGDHEEELTDLLP